MLYLRNFPIVYHRHNQRSDCTIPDAIHLECNHDMFYHHTRTENSNSLHSLSYDCNLSTRNRQLSLQKTNTSAGTLKTSFVSNKSVLCTDQTYESPGGYSSNKNRSMHLTIYLTKMEKKAGKYPKQILGKFCSN